MHAKREREMYCTDVWQCVQGSSKVSRVKNALRYEKTQQGYEIAHAERYLHISLAS